MLVEIVSNKSMFVILLFIAAFLSAGCNLTPSQTDAGSKRRPSLDYGEAKILGHISNREITESSGIANSACQPDVLWTHNDSGDGNQVFALNTKGESLGKWLVAGAANRDWEDIASFKDQKGECYLYISDTGNNGRTRASFDIFRVKEPTVEQGKTGRFTTARAETITFSYSDLRHDAEAIFVHPKSAEIYLITKRVSGEAGVYKIVKGSKVARKVADIGVPSVPNGLITGADISPDGKRVIVCDYFGGYEFVLPDDAESFDEIWKVKPRLVDLGTREQGEAVAYSADGLSLYATSEHLNSPLIMVSRKVED